MKLKKGVIIQQLGNEFVAFDNETITLHELNEVAYKILESLEKGKSKQGIINFLMKTYGVRKSQAAKDLEVFLEELNKKDLIEPIR